MYSPSEVAFGLKIRYVIIDGDRIADMCLDRSAAGGIQLQPCDETEAVGIEHLRIIFAVRPIVGHDYRIFRQQRQHLPQHVVEVRDIQIFPGFTVDPIGIPGPLSMDDPTVA